ncbi:MAG: hypothetical protein ACFFDF_16285 [Candidatus Odinarchaeota archaeon]
MEKSKLEGSSLNLRIGSFLILFMGMYTVIMALLWIFVTEIMFVSDFAYYTGMIYPDYLASDPRFAEIYIITKKLIGFILLANGAMIVLINQKVYRRGERWSWYAILIGGGISWTTFIIYKIYIGYIGASMITFVVGITLLIVGLVLPAKEILTKKTAY